jgi:hypothetical protein
MGLSGQIVQQTRRDREEDSALGITLHTQEDMPSVENNMEQGGCVGGDNLTSDSPNSQGISPNCDNQMEETTEHGSQELSQEKEVVEDPTESEKKAEEANAHKKGDQMIKQSERIREQGLGGSKLLIKLACWQRRKT